ncbi:alpha-amylase family glycosyl hydrolase [Pseudochryseolinea flava]|nr:alpha-amylase family glycosyl hydrolase [Pseudochryseolinea flava]
MMKKMYFAAMLMIACSGKESDPAPVTPTTPDEPKQYGTPFAAVPAPKDVVLYEVNTRAFSASGNFQGVIDRLDHIKSLGINTIWLMPIHPVGVERSAGGLGSPYAVKNYLEVNTEFGDLNKLRELVDEAHERNMAVIIDWVANHTSWDNPWIKNRTWYSQNGNGDIIIPPGTNWQDVAELNFANADMRKAMIAAMKYWVLEANIDGFRCDAVDFVPTDFWKQAIDQLNAIPGRELILLAEGGKADNFTAGFQMNYAWDFYNNLKDVYGKGKAATSIFTTHANEYNAIPAGKVKLRYTTNHDESAWEATPIEFFKGEDGALSASVITLFTSAVPLVYGSQEVGRAEKLAFFTRDPINWSANSDMLDNYEKLFAIYNQSDVFIDGSLQSFNDNDIAAFTRTLEDDQYFILANVRGEAKIHTLEASVKNSTWTNAMTGASVELSSTVELAPYAFLILKK